MKKSTICVSVLLSVTVILSCSAGAPIGGTTSASAEYPPKKGLRAFRSEFELNEYFRKLFKKRRNRGLGYGMGTGDGNSNAVASAKSSAETVEVSASPAAKDQSVTNVQHAGVDEGGIVKLHGDHLVVLRRGRLFTVAIGGNQLKPISSADAFGPDIDPRNTWYDEMLISGDTIAVIGYSYERGGTEVGLFNIDREGILKYRSTYHLRSNDYYSSRNYASRLIGRKLIFYSPMYISLYEKDFWNSFPAVRRWHKGAKESEFRRIVPASRVYQGMQVVDEDYQLALHTVTTCNIEGGEMDCEATSVIGRPGNVFYVSPRSVYVWTSDWYGDEKKPSTLYRMPLDGSQPSAVQSWGSPVDQFSFLESEDGVLNVLVRADAAGDAMWSAERAEGDVALVRIPPDNFGDGRTAVPVSQYRQLPRPEGYTFQNRFVGDHLIYGAGSGWGPPDKRGRSSVYVAKWNGTGVTELPLPHGVDRIESLGSDAIVVGTDGNDLHFTSVRLNGTVSVGDRYTFKGGSQGELRSHGFFYKPEDADSGVLGLPVRGPGRPGYEHLFNDSASILFLRNDSLRLSEIGSLGSRPEGSSDDACRASCVDWYGNARPLFIRGRIFALLGYEIVEGGMSGGRIEETRRINYGPRHANARAR